MKPVANMTERYDVMLSCGTIVRRPTALLRTLTGISDVGGVVICFATRTTWYCTISPLLQYS